MPLHARIRMAGRVLAGFFETEKSFSFEKRLTTITTTDDPAKKQISDSFGLSLTTLKRL